MLDGLCACFSMRRRKLGGGLRVSLGMSEQGMERKREEACEGGKGARGERGGRGGRGRGRVRWGVVVGAVSCALVVGLVWLWVDSYGTTSSASYSVGDGEPYQARPLEGERVGMWHDEVVSVGCYARKGIASFSVIRSQFWFYERPREEELFRGVRVSREKFLLPPNTPIPQSWKWPDVKAIIAKQRPMWAFHRTVQPTLKRSSVEVPFVYLVAAAGLPGAVVGVAWWWRRRRGGRGGCEGCGYSREGLPEGAVCPECGAGV